MSMTDKDNGAGSQTYPVAVVGSGRMGRGIAIAVAYSGCSVVLIDSEERSSEEFADLYTEINQELERELGFLQAVDLLDEAQASVLSGRICVASRRASGDYLQGASFIFEAVLEVVEVKKSTYQWLSEAASEKAILASTTSTMLSETLAEFVEGKERFLNAHWLNPAYLMPLVELSPSQYTSAECVESLKSFLETLGKVPVVCAASPGYIVSRLQAVAMNEAARLVEDGIASAEDIDKAVKVGFGLRYSVLGLLEFIDWGGCDILYYATNYLGEALDPRFLPPAIIKQKMDSDQKGLRDGAGFYDYREKDVAAYQQQRMSSFVKLLQHQNLMPNAVFDE